MLETPHVAFGAVIAKAIPNPLISVPLALASHFLLDVTPHWNPHLNTEIKKYGKLTNNTLLVIGLDLASSVLLTGFFLKSSLPDSTLFLNILLCSVASVLPDAVEGPYFIFGWKNKIVDKWIKFQKSIQVDANLFWGLLTQVLVVLGALYVFS